ncbi:MAG: bifunctional 5,10-methylenetetrahydrofolate dehydrogenase/5,10-methenyltetrahydrofolate cyclohydrolase [Candidatus Omnitrophota bacterium]
MAEIIDGKKIVQGLRAKLLKEFKAKGKGPARLVSIIIGDDPSCRMYTKSQQTLCREFDIEYVLIKLAAGTATKDAKSVLDKYNADRKTTGIIIQLPLPKAINRNELLGHINPKKDVEGLHPANIGRFFSGNCSLAPCTPAAVMHILKCLNVRLRGKEALIIGHSQIIGKPLSLMLLNEFATVTVCHIATSERNLLKEHVKRAEILISAVGVKGFSVPGQWLKMNAIVIDVATKGDIDFDSAKNKASYITPVPGGVGPVTNIMLINNLLELYKRA